MQRGVGDVEAGPLCCQARLECRHIGPRGRVGDADDPDLMRAQQSPKIEVAGVIHQHRVAGLQQQAADQVDGLGARSRQHELVGRDVHTLFGKAPEQQSAQDRRAARAAVVGEHRILGARKFPQGAAQSGSRHPIGRQPAATGLQDGWIGVERLPRYPERIDGLIAPRLCVRKRHRRQAGASDIEAGPAPGLDQALGSKTIIGFHDRGGRNAHGGGEAADRRQPVAAQERMAGHLRSDSGHDLAGARRFLALHSGSDKCVVACTSTVCSNCIALSLPGPAPKP